MRHQVRFVLSTWLLLASIVAPAIMLSPPVAAADERDCQCREFEDEVLVDARGDVNVKHPGTIDLFYMSVGEVFAGNLRENHMFFRIGMNITQPGGETVENDLNDAVPDPQEQGIPMGGVRPLPGDQFISYIEIRFRADQMPPDDGVSIINGTYSVRLSTVDRGETWRSNTGQLVFVRHEINGHDELLYLGSIQRFGLQVNDRLFDFQVEAFRASDENLGGERTDTMSGWEGADEAIPASLEPRGPQPGIPTGITQPDDLAEHAEGIDPARRDTWIPKDLDPERALDDDGAANARSANHYVKDGKERIKVRAYDDYIEADLNTLAWANFTIENVFKEIPQTVTMLAVFSPVEGWFFRYGPDTGLGTKVIAPGETADFQVVGYPFRGATATSVLEMTAVFVSDFGGLQYRNVIIVNTEPLQNEEDNDSLTVQGLPTRLVVTFINENDPHRVNEPRLLMFQVTDTQGRYVDGLEAARVYIWKAGESKPEQPHPLKYKPFMTGVYETPYTFHRPGAWFIEVVFHDYAANTQGRFPAIGFDLRVDHNDEGQPVVPMPLAVGGVGLGVLGLTVRERLQKKR